MIASRVLFASSDADTEIFVPSTAIVPTLTSPASAHIASTCVNRPANASAWVARNLAIVV